MQKLANFEDEDFSEREKVALRFAERIAVDHHSIDEAFFEQLRQHYSEAQIVELGLAITMMLGLGRLNVIFGLY